MPLDLEIEDGSAAHSSDDVAAATPTKPRKKTPSKKGVAIAAAVAILGGSAIAFFSLRSKPEVALTSVADLQAKCVGDINGVVESIGNVLLSGTSANPVNLSALDDHTQALIDDVTNRAVQGDADAIYERQMIWNIEGNITGASGQARSRTKVLSSVDQYCVAKVPGD